MRRVHLLTVLLATSAAVSAQATIPHSLADHWGETDKLMPWGKNNSRWQQIADRSALPPGLVQGSRITHIGVRRQGLDVTINPVALDTEIAIYDTLVPAGAISTTFAVNRANGSGGVAFARRIVNLPTVPLLNPRTSAHLLPLDAPRMFFGPNLLVEIVNRGAATVFTTWYANAALSHGSDGFQANVGAPCSLRPNLLGVNGPFRPGATFRVIEMYAAGAVALNVLGFSAVASRLGPLPIDLTAAGAPGCVVRPSLDIVVPVPGAGFMWVDYPIPPDQNLVGTKLYTQWINLDPTANPLGISVSASAVISIGARTYAMAHTERENDNQDTSGTGPFRGEGSVLAIAFQ